MPAGESLKRRSKAGARVWNAANVVLSARPGTTIVRRDSLLVYMTTHRPREWTGIAFAYHSPRTAVGGGGSGVTRNALFLSNLWVHRIMIIKTARDGATKGLTAKL